MMGRPVSLVTSLGGKSKWGRKSSAGKVSEFTVCLCVCVIDTHTRDNRKIKQQSVLLIFVLKHFHTHQRQHIKLHDPERWKGAAFSTGTL